MLKSMIKVFFNTLSASTTRLGSSTACKRYFSIHLDVSLMCLSGLLSPSSLSKTGGSSLKHVMNFRHSPLDHLLNSIAAMSILCLLGELISPLVDNRALNQAPSIL